MASLGTVMLSCLMASERMKSVKVSLIYQNKRQGWLKRMYQVVEGMKCCNPHKNDSQTLLQTDYSICQHCEVKHPAHLETTVKVRTSLVRTGDGHLVSHFSFIRTR